MATPYEDGTSSVNHQTIPIPVRRSERINLAALDGPPLPDAADLDDAIPELGVRSAAKWAKRFECDPTTVRRWVGKYQIPHKKPGNEIFIAARDLWDHLPYVTRPATPEDDQDSQQE